MYSAKLLKKLCGCNVAKRQMSVKRKYPIDPDHAKNLPVFDYGVSKKDYRRIFVWGNIQTGALGVPYMKNKHKIPTELEFHQSPKRLGFAEKFKVTTAACGYGFTAFAVEDDQTDYKLYGTGLNTDSQIGYHCIRKDHPMEMIFFPQPIALPFRKPKVAKINKLSAGRAHLAVLTRDEGLFLLGNNSYGQCGREIVKDENYFLSNYINHILTIDSKKIVDIECGQDHTLALTEDGSLYACGWGADGQTGLGHYSDTSEFTKVKGDIEGERIVKVSSRSDFVLALNDKGQVFGWGNAEYSQIQTEGEEQQVCSPTHIATLNHLPKIIDVAASGTTCAVLDETNRVFVWGFGILGAGPKAWQSIIPLELPQILFGKNDFQPDSKVISIHCGLSHLIAVTNQGEAYTWGRNLKGCLGLGEKEAKDQYFPFRISMGGFVEEISCGVDHTLAICKPFI